MVYSNGELEAHLRNHTREISVECLVCSKPFAQCGTIHMNSLGPRSSTEEGFHPVNKI